MIQSLDRGLSIIGLLSRSGPMTATAIAEQLQIHQSTASRHLASLHKAGFVRKPDFHSFALDWETLIFAGNAMSCFPAIPTAVKTCNEISLRTGCSATIALVRGGRLLYLTRANADSSILLVNNSDFPIHESSVGLALSCEGNESDAITILTSGGITKTSAKVLYIRVSKQLRALGFIYLQGIAGNVFNAARPFTIGEDRAALAIYSGTKNVPRSQVSIWLKRGIVQFEKNMGDYFGKTHVQ